MESVFLLTGRPGTGKTTVIRKALSLLQLKTGGFYTQEIRLAGVRKGFKIITLDGEEAILSHVDFHTKTRIGKYGIDLEALDSVGVSSIYRAMETADLIVIDEIGRMELLSLRFREVILKAFNSGKKILASIMLNPHSFADNIKKRPGVKLIQITAENREAILHDLLRELG